MKIKIFVLASLSVICMLAISCRKKKQSVTYPYNNTQKMAGTRHWVGIDTLGFAPLPPASVSLDFAISPLNSTSVSVLNDVLNYVTYSESGKYMVFTKKGSQDTVSLTYYYEADSIAYYKYERASSCCYSLRHLHSQK